MSAGRRCRHASRASPALDLDGAPVASPEFRDFDCYVFGNEARGLPREQMSALRAQAFTIPGTGAIESLNVAATVNICLYELNRAADVKSGTRKSSR